MSECDHKVLLEGATIPVEYKPEFCPRCKDATPTPQNLPRTEGCGYHSNEPEHFDENCLMCYKKALDLERLRADGLEKELEILNSIHGDVHVAHGEALTRAEVAEKKLSQMDEFAFNIQAKLEEAEKEVGRLKNPTIWLGDSLVTSLQAELATAKNIINRLTEELRAKVDERDQQLAQLQARVLELEVVLNPFTSEIGWTVKDKERAMEVLNRTHKGESSEI